MTTSKIDDDDDEEEGETHYPQQSISPSIGICKSSFINFTGNQTQLYIPETKNKSFF